jgi:hypothetical protein
MNMSHTYNNNKDKKIIFMQFRTRGRSFMDSGSGYNCWEMMSCDNLGCPARHEPETPCWEIAERADSYQDNDRKCKECVVYLLKANATFLNLNKLKTLAEKGEFWEKIGSRHKGCIV